MIDYSFTAQDMQAASDEWFCNCGPASLAFALQIGLDQVRGKIPGFEEKHYTSPTMMKAGLKAFGKTFQALPADVANMFRSSLSWPTANNGKSCGISLARCRESSGDAQRWETLSQWPIGTPPSSRDLSPPAAGDGHAPDS